MRSRPPLTRVQLIERSLRCFVSGLFGLLPVIGLPFAVHAAAICLRTRRHKPSAWNPAERYLVCGAIFARLGLLITLVLALVILYGLIQN